ncbi:hypothetical protein [Chryseobacterium angstadtii]|uniref:hypothetical protein n=1 Tax=Chryseobacterium angstadtii TaxID=558151 RepID=UPI000A544D67|nr:hypothetical protein [Chryseobacterium angstadtii]
MKKSNFQPRKLSKKELKGIKGGARPICFIVISCYDPATGEEQYGVPGHQDGNCC